MYEPHNKKNAQKTAKNTDNGAKIHKILVYVKKKQ